MCQEIMPRRSAAFFWVSTLRFRPKIKLLMILQASLFQRHELPGDVQAMVDSILHQYGPQVTQVIIHNIGGEAARSELEILADPLRKMVFAQPSAKQWISDALFGSAFPSSKVSDGEKRIWLQQVIKYVSRPLIEPELHTNDRIASEGPRRLLKLSRSSGWRVAEQALPIHHE